MTLTVELTLAQELQLKEEAARAGLEPAALLLARAGLADTPHTLNLGKEPGTGADLLALWEQEDAFLPHEDLSDSPALARALREQAQTRVGQ